MTGISFRHRGMKTVAGTPNSRNHSGARAPLLSHATARPRQAGTSFESQAQQRAGSGSESQTCRGPLNVTSQAHCHPGQGPQRLQTIGRIPRAMSDQDRQHSVTNADLRRGARSPNPGAVRLAGHMSRHGQSREALQSIWPGAVTLEGAGSLRSPPIAPLACSCEFRTLRESGVLCTQGRNRTSVMQTTSGIDSHHHHPGGDGHPEHEPAEGFHEAEMGD